jgi:PIN domain nuclease of toxin-antitoxin system
VKSFLDTHAAVALWRGDVDAFGRRSQDLLERSTLFVSPVARLELALLAEIGRLNVAADEIVDALTVECGVMLANDPIQAVVAKAMDLHWTRDPFDRLLVATAILHKAPLVTRDRLIHEHFEDAVW